MLATIEFIKNIVRKYLLSHLEYSVNVRDLKVTGRFIYFMTILSVST